jgi:hypothetical protein
MSGYYPGAPTYQQQQQLYQQLQPGASPMQIGQAVQIRNQYPVGHPIRQEANQIVHSEKPDPPNKYTSNYQHSDLAQKFIDKHL